MTFPVYPYYTASPVVVFCKHQPYLEQRGQVLARRCRRCTCVTYVFVTGREGWDEPAPLPDWVVDNLWPEDVRQNR